MGRGGQKIPEFLVRTIWMPPKLKNFGTATVTCLFQTVAEPLLSAKLRIFRVREEKRAASALIKKYEVKSCSVLCVSIKLTLLLLLLFASVV